MRVGALGVFLSVVAGAAAARAQEDTQSRATEPE
jgi:hypothetical protein